MTKSVGILTFHDALNYGAVLQAFALQQTIASYSCSCSIINYRRPGYYPMFRCLKSKSDIKTNILTFLYLRSHLKLRKRFSQFRTANLNSTIQSYSSLEDFCRSDSKFDVYVTGSDQVWNPYLLDRQGGVGSIFYLGFVSDGRRVAYAPSFGNSEVPEVYKERIAGFLKRFDFLSSREDIGCSIIRDLSGLNSVQVLDPTFLQDSSIYKKVAVEPRFSKPYILLYPMQESDLLISLVLNVRKILRIPIVAVLPSHFNPLKYRFADKIVFDAGPAEFLGWVDKSSFVCTNSFHGTCFAIIYRKNFLGVQSILRNSRIQSLLKCVGLSSRLVIDPDRFSKNDDLLKPIDYFSVYKILENEIKNSLDYLKVALA
ncbi:polysaccharide pyruvyl transferase family protein [Chlorobaculum thiosulfatiphilum]|uniref:Polysaccharide pyruvyl transferase family protein n=1 Tax=Chlorobaculum thiosulfatiphilum TaxID=115852 RepID=A0A5C4S5K2_CHLTI|nr:polysaccharide pyruvyl transferase family protein [Chlorobaculum thiosulfatiphilum]TNJ38552.1 polysaccharide pyruvyl transferase family protein [Chlorobaculum thiosulfatiphilum]